MKNGFVYSKKAEAKAAKMRMIQAAKPTPPTMVNNYKTAASTVSKSTNVKIIDVVNHKNEPIVAKPSVTTKSNKVAPEPQIPVVNGKQSQELVSKVSAAGGDTGFIPSLKPKTTKKDKHK